MWKKSMKYVLANYNYTPDWLPEYTNDYIIFDQSESDEWLKDFPQSHVVKKEHKGNVDYDKLTYLAENYDSLPDVFVWGKTNLFKYISRGEFDEVKDNEVFTPLLTQGHRTYSDNIGVVCAYHGQMYYERNDNWYLVQFSSHYGSFSEWAKDFQLPSPPFIPFAPGGNYILTRETVHKYSRDYYERMASKLPYCTLPGEAHLAERSYYLMWA